MAFFLVEKRRHANTRQEKFNHLLNMAGRILLLRLIMMAIVDMKLEVFLTKTPALSYIIKKCFMIRRMEVSLTRKFRQSE